MLSIKNMLLALVASSSVVIASPGQPASYGAVTTKCTTKTSKVPGKSYSTYLSTKTAKITTTGSTVTSYPSTSVSEIVESDTFVSTSTVPVYSTVTLTTSVPVTTVIYTPSEYLSTVTTSSVGSETITTSTTVTTSIVTDVPTTIYDTGVSYSYSTCTLSKGIKTTSTVYATSCKTSTAGGYGY